MTTCSEGEAELLERSARFRLHVGGPAPVFTPEADAQVLNRCARRVVDDKVVGWRDDEVIRLGNGVNI